VEVGGGTEVDEGVGAGVGAGAGGGAAAAGGGAGGGGAQLKTRERAKISRIRYLHFISHLLAWCYFGFKGITGNFGAYPLRNRRLVYLAP